MIVCSCCGIPLHEAREDDPPETCHWCIRHHWQPEVPQWVEYEDREARLEQERAKTRPVPQPLPEGFGGIALIGDELKHPYFEYALGEKVTHKSQMRRLIKEKGLQAVSLKEHYRDQKKPHRPKIVSYSGQKHHKSRVEDHAVRTGSGQRVI